MVSRVIFSKNKLYRYSLSRIWNKKLPRALFIMLNPSTADHITNDHTICRCRGYAKNWGYGSIEVVNLFAYRSTVFYKLFYVDDPIGPKNDKIIKDAIKRAKIVIAAWGNKGCYKSRNKEVEKFCSKLYYLKSTHSGLPAHPLYLDKDLKPILWK